MKVFLAKVGGYGGGSVIGVFSTKEKALRASVDFFVKKSYELCIDAALPTIPVSISETEEVYDLWGSTDSLYITRLEVDKP